MSTSRKLFTTSAAAFAFRLIGAGIMLGVQVLIARKLGGEQLGLYAVLLSVCNVITVVLPLGFQTIAGYYAANYASSARGHPLRQFMLQAYGQTLLAAVVAFFFGAQLIALFGFDAAVITDHWPILVAVGLGLALMQLSASILISFKKALVGLVGDAVLRPWLTAAALLMALQSASQLEAIPYLFKLLAIAFGSLALLYFLFTVLAARQIPASPEPMGEERRNWWFYAAPWALMALGTDFFFDIDLLLLTPFLSLADLAVFGIAARLVSLAAFGVNAIYAVSLPDLFSAQSREGDAAFMQHIQRTNRIAVLMACLMLAGAVVVAPFMLAVLGKEFALASTPFAILCLTPLIRAVFGPTALLLSMHEKPYAPLPPMMLGFTTLLLANLVLVPLWHINGAAISAVLATLVWSFSLWVVAKRETGLSVAIFSNRFAAQKIADLRG